MVVFVRYFQLNPITLYICCLMVLIRTGEVNYLVYNEYPDDNPLYTPLEALREYNNCISPDSPTKNHLETGIQPYNCLNTEPIGRTQNYTTLTERMICVDTEIKSSYGDCSLVNKKSSDALSLKKEFISVNNPMKPSFDCGTSQIYQKKLKANTSINDLREENLFLDDIESIIKRETEESLYLDDIESIVRREIYKPTNIVKESIIPNYLDTLEDISDPSSDSNIKIYEILAIKAPEKKFYKEAKEVYIREQFCMPRDENIHLTDELSGSIGMQLGQNGEGYHHNSFINNTNTKTESCNFGKNKYESLFDGHNHRKYLTNINKLDQNPESEEPKKNRPLHLVKITNPSCVNCTSKDQIKRWSGKRIHSSTNQCDLLEVKKYSEAESLRIGEDYSSISKKARISQDIKTNNGIMGIKKRGNSLELRFNLNGTPYTHQFDQYTDEYMILKEVSPGKYKTYNTSTLIDKDELKPKNTFAINFSFKVPIFSSLHFKSFGEIKYLKIRSSCNNDSINHDVTGLAYFPLNYEKIRNYMVLLENNKQDYNNFFNQLLNIRFALYDFSNSPLHPIQKVIVFKKRKFYYFERFITISEYFDIFQSNKDLFLKYRMSIYNKIGEMSLSATSRNKNRITCDSSIFLIGKAVVVFIESVKQISKILSLPYVSDPYILNQEINILIDNILSDLRPSWEIVFTAKKKDLNVQESMLVSFYIFLHQEVKFVLEYLQKYIFTNKEYKYVDIHSIHTHIPQFIV